MRIALSPSAEKQFLKLSRTERKKVEKRLRHLESHPFAGKKLYGEFEGHRALRAWPHRIIYEVNHKKGLILVSFIAHRQGAYK